MPTDIVADRTIWMFWGGALPDHLAACIGKAEQLRGDARLIVVEPDTARRFAPELPQAWDTLESWAHRSDVLAPHLLDTHGGLYVDVDTIAVAAIDAMIEQFVAGDRDFVAFLNAHGKPSVGVMWSRAGAAVAQRYRELVDARLADDTTDLGWVALGSPLLATAFAAAGSPLDELDPMLGAVALFHWPAWRTFTLPDRPLDPYLRLLPDGGASLTFVALFHSRSGESLAGREERTVFDGIFEWVRPSAPTVDPRTGPEPTVTFMVKTFNRPRTISHTVARLRTSAPNASIIVVDDSADDHLADLSDFEVAHLVIEFDAGLSRGRNIGISHITSDYFVMHDDDQFPAQDFDLESAILVMDQWPALDAAGGWEDETPHVRDHLELAPDGVLVQRRHTPWSYMGQGADAVPLFHMVQNQTLWRTATFRSKKLRWTPDLKVGEHVDFFFRYRGQINIVFLPELHFANVPMGVRARDEETSDYEAYRSRQNAMWKRFKAKHDLRRVDVVNHALPDDVFAFERAPVRAIAANMLHMLRGRFGR